MSSQRRALASSGPAGNAALSFQPHTLAPPSSMKKPIPRSSGLPRASMAAHPYSTVSRPSSAAGEQFNHKRRSMMPPSRPADALTSSATRGDGGIMGRTPQASRALTHTRRSSAFGPTGGRPSTLASGYGAHQSFKDPRSIRATAFTNECKENIAQYLSQCKAQLALSSNWQSSPTSRDFQNLFRFLAMELVGPNFPWGKSFEKDSMAILRDLHYPVLDTISKTAFTAPGSHQSWPHLVAMLDWMVELCKAQERWHDPQSVSDPLLRHASDLSPHHPQLEERLFWDFVSATYSEWFDSAIEEFGPAQRQLEEAYDRIAAASVEQCERLEREVNEREGELQRLQSEDPPIKLIDEEYERLMSDKGKFDNFIEMHRQRVDNLTHKNESLRGAIEDMAQRAASTRKQLSDIEAEVSAQNLSAEEISRMNQDKVTLAQHLQDVTSKIAEAKRHAHDQELRVTQSMDRCDQQLDEYNVLGNEIGTLGVIADPQPKGFVRTDYSFTLDLGAERPQEILQDGRAKLATIRPALDSYAQGSRDQVDKLCDEETTLEEKRLDLVFNVESQREEVHRRQLRYDQERKQVDEQREMLKNEMGEHSQAVANLEAEVRGKGLAQTAVVQANMRLERSKAVYDSLLQKTQLFQTHALGELLVNIETISAFKSHTEESLESVMRFAERQD